MGKIYTMRLFRILTCLIIALNITPRIDAQETKSSSRDVLEKCPSINLVIVSDNNYNVAVSGLFSVFRNNAYGLQLGGLYNHIGNKGAGLEIGGLGNTVTGSFYGVQIGGLFNVVQDASNALQIAGLANITSDVNGFQMAGLANVAKDVNGVQFSGLTNIARNVNGLQFGGLVNIAKKVKGVQFASILNVADESCFPIGLINIIKNGEMGVVVTYDILGNTSMTFRSGGKYSYGVVGVGYNHRLEDSNKIVAEAGYGIHIPVCRWMRIDNELKGVSSASSRTSFVNFSYLLAPSFKLWEHFNLFGGPSINYFVSPATSGVEKIIPSSYLWSKTTDRNFQQLYLGYQFGLQYIF